MAHRNPVTAGEDRIDVRGEVASWFGSKLLAVGVLLILIGAGGLVYYASHFSNASEDAVAIANVQGLIDKLRIGLIIGMLVFAAGMTVNFWGDAALPLTLMLVGLVFLFAGDLLGLAGLVSEGDSAIMMRVSNICIGGLRVSGLVLVIVAIILQIIDVSVRVRNRSIHGAREDAKYGQGIREEKDYQNVFMGKCWQLPFCRKFVRERCPIFHSRRTCWKERVGCMCDEEVIRGAMESKAIPRDVVAAAKFIPRNTRLSAAQKAERCRQCVIYNEHQRHKYKLAVPTVMLSFTGIYALFHTPMLAGMNRILRDIDIAFAKFALTSPNREYHPVIGAPGWLDEVMLVLVLLFILSQLMKVVEFGIFKLKV